MIFQVSQLQNQCPYLIKTKPTAIKNKKIRIACMPSDKLIKTPSDEGAEFYYVPGQQTVIETYPSNFHSLAAKFEVKYPVHKQVSHSINFNEESNEFLSNPTLKIDTCSNNSIENTLH